MVHIYKYLKNRLAAVYFDTGDHTRCEGTMYTSGQTEQSQSLCEWYRLGTPLQLSYLYCRYLLKRIFYLSLKEQ